MVITFVGHGYVGLVSACVFAKFGNTVYILGHTKEKIDRLKTSDPIIYEPGLKELLEDNLKKKRIIPTLDYKSSVSRSDIVFIAVGTPPKNNGEADLTTVFEVAKNIAQNLKRGFTVVSCKSTVPVGTNQKIEQLLKKNKVKDAEFAVASCPEFLREGSAIYDTLNADRVVVGSDSEKAIDLLLKLHEPIPGKRVVTDLASAELIKYTSNAMLATKISFANLIAFYCEKTGADVEKVLDAVGLDKRIGRIFMDPGLGYGGSCLPKDVKALRTIGANLAVDTIFLDAVEKVNSLAKNNFIARILKTVKDKNVAIWGLSFKPNTDDVREAPAIYIINALLQNNFSLHVYDSAALGNIKKIFGGKLRYAKNPYDAVSKTSALLILTEWDEFKQINLKQIKTKMLNPVIFDGRNIYDPHVMKSLGFTYYSIGRPSVK